MSPFPLSLRWLSISSAHNLQFLSTHSCTPRSRIPARCSPPKIPHRVPPIADPRRPPPFFFVAVNRQPLAISQNQKCLNTNYQLPTTYSIQIINQQSSIANPSSCPWCLRGEPCLSISHSDFVICAFASLASLAVQNPVDPFPSCQKQKECCDGCRGGKTGPLRRKPGPFEELPAIRIKLRVPIAYRARGCAFSYAALRLLVLTCV
jgi:hypothetical protein